MASTTESMSLPKVVVAGGWAAALPAIPANRSCACCTAVTSTLTQSAPNTAPVESRRTIVDDVSRRPFLVRVR